MPYSAELLERVFNTLVHSAVIGERCPANGTHGIVDGAPAALAHAGRILIEVGARNYRVVTILTGDHAGKHTLKPPGPWKPHRRIDKNGSHEIGRKRQIDYGKSKRPQPTTPRLPIQDREP